MCSLLTPIEALDATDAFLMSIYGRQLFEKWRKLKYDLNFLSEQEYVRWLLELGERHQGSEHMEVTHGETAAPATLCSDYVHKHCEEEEEETVEELGEGRAKEDEEQDVYIVDEVECTQQVAEFCEVNSVTIPDDTSLDDVVIDHSANDKGTTTVTNTRSKPKLKPSARGKSKTCVKSEIPENEGADQSESYVGPGTPDDDGVTSDGDDSMCGLVAPADGASGQEQDSGDDLNMSTYYTTLPDGNCRNVFTCNTCYTYTSYRRSNIVSHIREVHLKLKRLACNFCDYQASRRGHLRDHLILKHGYLSKYVCHACRRPFASRAKLERHANTCGGTSATAPAPAKSGKSTARSKRKR